jgi:hypothetical protein
MDNVPVIGNGEVFFRQVMPATQTESHGLAE